MATYSNPRAIPGVTSARTTTPRRVFAGGTAQFLPSSQIIGGTASRDATNTGDVDVLRAGKVMGKITSGGKWAPSILGVTTNAETGATTTIEAAAGVVTELVRRVGATGTFKLTGPPTAAGTVRTLTITYSAASSTNITVTAPGVADVWTLTAPAGQDAGMYQLEITTGKGTSAEVVATTVALAANANTATVDAALEALANVGVAGVAAVYSDPTLTLTFASNLGPVHVRVISDTTNDGGVFEGGWAAVHTTTGVDGRFVAGSLIQPTDGSETPLSFIGDLDSCYGHKVTDQDGTAIDTQFHQIPVMGIVDSSQLIDWPSDTSLQAWLAGSLNAAGVGRFVFDHLLTA